MLIKIEGIFLNSGIILYFLNDVMLISNWLKKLNQILLQEDYRQRHSPDLSTSGVHYAPSLPQYKGIKNIHVNVTVKKTTYPPNPRGLRGGNVWHKCWTITFCLVWKHNYVKRYFFFCKKFRWIGQGENKFLYNKSILPKNKLKLIKNRSKVSYSCT